MPIIKMNAQGKDERGEISSKKRGETDLLRGDDDLDRILNIRMDAVVIVARKEMSVNELLKLKHGSVIEFEKSVKEPLTLELNGKPVALGATVKIVERFGLQVTEVVPVDAKIKAMK